jgi:hypothetical protein
MFALIFKLLHFSKIVTNLLYEACAPFCKRFAPGDMGNLVRLRAHWGASE